MQIYTDASGIQQITPGTIVIDSDSGQPIFKVVWDAEVHGGQVDLAKVGGYTNSNLTYSQDAFAANEALKVTAAAREAEEAKAALGKSLDTDATGKAIAFLNERLNALVEAIKTGDLKAIQLAVAGHEKLQPLTDEEAIAAVKEKLAATEK